jgi:uncharacterized iron-regulated membrane protein
MAGAGAVRAWVRRVHLWMGLSIGAWFVLLGLTGSVLAFYPEIDRWLNPAVQVAGHANGDSYARAIVTLRTAYPDKDGPWRLEITGAKGAIPARYYNPTERAGHAFRPMMVWLSADGGHVLRRDYWGEYAVTFIYDLHYSLLLGEVGGTIVGWGGFILLALLLSGLWAWWPRGSWRKAFRIKRAAPPVRALRDWHKSVGLGGLTFLLILTITGIMLALPMETENALTVIGAPMDTPPTPPKIAIDAPQIGVTTALSSARTAIPNARVAWIETPGLDGGYYRIRMQERGDPSYRFPNSFVWVNPYSGAPMAVQRSILAGNGKTIMNWLHPLHDGSAGGGLGRILVMLSGLVPLFLFVTGLLRYGLLSRRRPFKG